MIFSNNFKRCADTKSGGEVSEILTMVIRRVQYSPGCIQSELWKSKDNYKFMVSEIWKTKPDYDRLVYSTLFKRLLPAVEMSPEKPEIRISECENIRGIELIEEILIHKKA
jgi:quinol monooxygenase YgiN